MTVLGLLEAIHNAHEKNPDIMTYEICFATKNDKTPLGVDIHPIHDIFARTITLTDKESNTDHDFKFFAFQGDD